VKTISSPCLLLLLVLALGQECVGSGPTGLSPFSGLIGQDSISNTFREYQNRELDWRKIIRPGAYVRSGNYLNWSAWSDDPSTWAPAVKPDANGVLMITYDGGLSYVYNPTTITLHALYLHSLYMRGYPLDPKFKADADFLLQMQGEDGAVRYAFALDPFPVGWVSGQAQGHAISVWTRAYKLFGDSKYLDAARRSYIFMMRDVSEGGCLESLADIDPSLSGYKLLTEVPFKPYQYALDGSIFPLLGIYDLSEFDPSVMSSLTNLVETIRVMLPYYELGGISAYDLQYIVNGSQPVVEPSFHGLNTGLVWTLNSIVPDPVFEQTWQRWANDASQPGPAPLNLKITPIDGGLATIDLKLPEPIRINGLKTIGGDALEPSDVLMQEVVEPNTPAIEVEMSAPTGFFKVARPFPVIDGATLNGGFERWNSPSDMASWEEINIGGTVQQESSEVHSGSSSVRIDATSSAPAGMYRYGVINPGAQYYLKFWAKASTQADLTVYFGPGRDPVKTITLSTNWTRYVVYDRGTDIVDSLAIYSATSGVSIYLDDLKLWEFDGK
jgi:hypothetical protein